MGKTPKLNIDRSKSYEPAMEMNNLCTPKIVFSKTKSNNLKHKKRSKSINISNLKTSSLIDRSPQNKANKAIKKRRRCSEMSFNPNKDRKRLLNIEKICKEQKIKKRKIHKRKKNKISRSKSEDHSVGNTKASKKAIIAPLTPLQDHTNDLTLNAMENERIALLLNADCNFKECPSRKRVIAALEYYEAKYDDNGHNNEMMEGLMEKYEHLLSDWHHILSIHLNTKSIQNHEIFNCLYDDIKRHHLLCDIDECSHFIKNNRNREEIKECNDGYDHFNDDIDLNDQFLMDLLDDIHIHLVHSFDIGFRMRNFTDFKLQTNNEREDCLY